SDVRLAPLRRRTIGPILARGNARRNRSTLAGTHVPNEPKRKLRAKILRGGLLPSRFKPGRWYPAELTSDGKTVVLMKGRATTARPIDEVEIRPAPDDAWEVRAASRLTFDREG